jgi:tetratricopeptide (TPR) repeat protein
MKIHFLLLLICTVLFLQISTLAKDEWLSVRSKNFTLVGNAGEKEIRRVGTKLEQFRETFRQLFPKANFNTTKPNIVVVFKNQSDYRPYKPLRADGTVNDWIAGYFQAGEDANYITLSTERESEATFDTIFHEYVHFIVNNNYGKAAVPPWFNEGLAEYYETFRLEDERKAVIGELQANHLRLLQEQKLIPFDRFFTIDYYTLHNQGNHGKSLFYSQAWALMHYFQQGNKGARRAQFSKFLNLIINKTAPAEAFKEAFQTDYATMEKELKDYVSQRTFTGTVITLKDKLIFDGEMQTAPLSEAESTAYLGDLLLHINRLPDAEKTLRQAISLDEKNEMAHAALGMTLVRQKRFDEAKAHLEKAVALDSKNYLPHFYYAYALSREEMDMSGFIRSYPVEKAEKMQQSLTRAIELNPNFAESYRLLSFISFVNNTGLDEAVAALDKGLQLEPGNQQLALDKAQILMRQEKFDEARRLAQKVFASAAEAQLRGNAQILINNINSFEAQLKDIAERNKRPPSEGEETVIQLSEEELINQSLNEAIRKPRAGEKRIIGFLTKIDCDPNAISFVIRTPEQIFKFRTDQFQNVAFMAFTSEATGQQIDCGTRKSEEYVIATYKPADPKAKHQGELVAIEFMPKEFKLK